MPDNIDSPSPAPNPEERQPPMVIPARRPTRPAPPDRPRSSGGAGRLFLVLLLLASIGLNFLLCMGVLSLFGARFGGISNEEGPQIYEKHWSGTAGAHDKIAVIRIEGPLVDDFMGYTLKQIDKAAKDENVKAVVVRINSPGGTITASDDIHKRLMELRNGNSPRYTSTAKHLVVSMGPTAASGGYYIAMPGEYLFAEKTTITGSIGVYASFLNVYELGQKYGVKMEMIKAGDVKGAGSPFSKMKPEERQVWKEMVDNAYAQFIDIVETGRPHLKGMLTKNLNRKDQNGKQMPTEIPDLDDNGDPIPGKKVPYHRKLADGGIFVAWEAKQLGLVDEIGYLDDATKKAATLAGLSSDYEVIVYERPPSLFNLLGGGIKQPGPQEFSKAAQAAGPQVWYMCPNAEFAGMLAIMGKE
jgi:protease-4